MHLIVNIYHLNNPSSKLLLNQSLSTQKSQYIFLRRLHHVHMAGDLAMPLTWVVQRCIYL